MEGFDHILGRLGEIAGRWGLVNIQPLVGASRDLLASRDGLEVAVVGRFKAGKSSFLNHLTGREVLPVGAVPLTAIVTRLGHGPCDRATVRFRDGTSIGIGMDDIGAYVDERRNPENARGVESVDIELASGGDMPGLRFIDMPGIGSALEHNTEAVRHWLPNAGATLVAVSCDAPLSERDLCLLDELRRHTPHMALLLTKADLLSAPEMAEVLAFVTGQMARRWGDGIPQVFFYSIRPGLEHLGPELRRAFLWPLVRESNGATRRIVRHKIRVVLGQTLDYLRVARAALGQSESARAALRVRLDVERAQMAMLRDEMRALARSATEGAIDRSLRQLAPDIDAIRWRVAGALAEQFPRWRMRLPALMRAYGEWLDGMIRREMEAVSGARAGNFCAPLEHVREHLSRSLRAFQDRLAGHVRDALGLSLMPHQLAPDVPAPDAPPVHVSTACIVSVEIYGHLVPMFLFRPAVRRWLLRRAGYEVEKNIWRLAANWGERVTAAVGALVRVAEKCASDELDALVRVASPIDSDLPHLDCTIGEVQSLLDGMDGPEEAPAGSASK